MTKQSSTSINKIATTRHGGSRNDNNQPQQYTKGYVEFYKLKFKVTPDVLIPRPETELLVDEVLNFVKDSHVATRKSFRLSPPRAAGIAFGDARQNDDNVIARSPRRPWQSYTIIDLGTGAGNIAISLALHLEGVNVTATDVSQKALEVAKQNAKFHGVKDRIKFIQSDLLEKVTEAPDIIVTNLPYIPSERIAYLDSSVKDFEPHIALDGGDDGFGLYRKLFQQIKEKNWKPKLIIGEIDYTHGELAANEAYKYFPEAEIEVKKDLAHLQRILQIRHLL